MKIEVKKYALALYEATEGKGRAEAKTAVLNFVSLLVKNNDQSKLKAIIASYTEIYNQREGIVETEINSARELDHITEKALSSYLETKMKAKKIIIKKGINPSLLGGFVIRYRDKIIDASIKAKIASLKKDMIK